MNSKQKALSYAKTQGRALFIDFNDSGYICDFIKNDLSRHHPQYIHPIKRNQPIIAIHNGQLKATPHASPFSKPRFTSTNNDSFLQGIVAVSVIVYDFIPVFIRHATLVFLLLFRRFMECFTGT